MKKWVIKVKRKVQESRNKDRNPQKISVWVEEKKIEKISIIFASKVKSQKFSGSRINFLSKIDLYSSTVQFILWFTKGTVSE